MAGTFAKATAIGGLLVPVAEIALPRAAIRCFPDLVSRDSNGLVLISFRRRAHPRVRAVEDSLGVNACLDDLRRRQPAVAIFAV
jgi:hypothetical protein